MEVRAAVAPAVEMDASDVAEREDRTLDPRGHAAEVGRELLRQVGEGVDVIGLVSSRVGYSTPSAFVAAFRTHIGVTPGRYFDPAQARISRP